MQINPATEQNKNTRWSKSPWNQSGRKGKPCQVWNCWSYPLPYYSVLAADTLLYVITMTFDLWPWTFAVYHVLKLCTKFERNRAIRGRVIASGFQGCLDPTLSNLLRAIIATQEVCFSVQIPCCISKLGRLTVEWCWKQRQISRSVTAPPLLKN